MHPRDVKYRAIVHYTHFCRSLRKVAKMYNVSKSTLHRWVNVKETHSPRHRRSSMKIRMLEVVKQTLEQNPFCTMSSIVQSMKAGCGLTVSLSTASRFVKAVGFTKKKAFRASSRPPGREQVLAFCQQYQEHQGNVVCIDEACFYLGDHPRLGYAPRGKRLHIASSPTLRRTKFTLILAIDRTGVVHYDVSECNCTKMRFVEFVNGITKPPGTVLLMDNVAFHHSKETTMAIQSKGFKSIFVPPYSPRLNAIENVFSRVKQLYRSHCPATFDGSFDYVSLLLCVLHSFGHCHKYFERVDRLVLDTLANGGACFSGVDQ